MQFAIWEPIVPCPTCVVRDMYFAFQETGGYKPLLVGQSPGSFVYPQAIVFLPSLRRLAIPDGISSGLLMFNLDTLAVTETYM